jgi:cell division septation protein DedD
MPLQDTYSFYSYRQKLCQENPDHILCKTFTKAQGQVESSHGKGNFTVQVGSFQNKASATQLLSKLKGVGPDARLVSSVTSGKKNWYRVQIGRFLDRQSAQKWGEQLQSQGIIQQFIATPYEP